MESVSVAFGRMHSNSLIDILHMWRENLIFLRELDRKCEFQIIAMHIPMCSYLLQIFLNVNLNCLKVTDDHFLKFIHKLEPKMRLV